MIGAKIGKVWGNTISLFAGNNVEVHRIRAKKGFRCSQHTHRAKYNLFYVLAGKLLVHVHKDGLADKTQLGGGQYTVVAPGDAHWFEVIEEVDALEIYWVELDPEDIERQDHGGEVA